MRCSISMTHFMTIDHNKYVLCLNEMVTTRLMLYTVSTKNDSLLILHITGRMLRNFNLILHQWILPGNIIIIYNIKFQNIPLFCFKVIQNWKMPSCKFVLLVLLDGSISKWRHPSQCWWTEKYFLHTGT